MAALSTNFNYVYAGKLTSELFYKPSIETPNISDIAIIDMGVRFKKQYNRVPILNKILKPYTGCERNFTEGKAIDNVTLETKSFEVNVKFCVDDFTNELDGRFNILAEEMLKTGIDTFDIGGTEVQTVIDNMMEDALRRDTFRRFSFGDSTSGSPDWNTIDGLWQRLIDTAGGSNYCVRKIAGNLGTGALTAGQGLATLQAVYDGSSNLLKAVLTKLKYFVTGSIYDNYVKSLQGTGATEQAYTATINGIKTITFNGIPVIPIRAWDEDLADVTNPLSSTTRHLVLLTIRENHRFGVENGKDLNRIEGWYDRDSRLFKFEGKMKFGYQYLHCDFATIAY